MKIKILFGIGALGLAIALSGCTKNSKEDGENVMRIAVVAKIKSIDPVITGGDLYANEAAGFTYESLLEYHYLKRPYVLTTNLASEMPEISKDGKTFTFKLKQGVKFQDDECFPGGKGREVVAADIAYAIRRLADPGTNAQGWWLFDGKVVGLNEWRDEITKGAKADYDKPIAGIQLPDKYTLKIQLTKRNYQFIYAFAISYTSATAREAVEHYGKDFGRMPVGSGPYMLDRANSDLNSKMVWLRNPNYRGEKYPTECEPGDKDDGLLNDAGKAMPFIDKFIVTVFVESQPKWLNFMKGDLDLTSIPKDNYSQAVNPDKTIRKELADKGIRLRISPSLDLTYHGFNTEDPILKNKKIRQAISLATNWDHDIELFYNGAAIRAQTPIPPGMSGYNKNYVSPYSPRNIEKAKKLLAEAGFPEGKGLPEITNTTPSSSTDRQFAEALAKDVGEIGIKLRHTPLSWPEFTTALKNKKVQIYGMAWRADYPDAENFLQLFYGRNVSPGENSSNFKNAEFDRMYEQALAMGDTPERSKLYQKMGEFISEERPFDLGVHRLAQAVIHKWVKNSKPHEFGHLRFKYLRIDPQLRVETKKKF